MGPLALALLLCAGAAPARAQAWIGTSSGTIETGRVGQDRWDRVVRLPAALKPGMHVRAGGGASATVVLADHSRLRLSGGSELVVDDLGPKGAGLKLQSGAAEVFAAAAAAPRLSVRTPSAFVSGSDAEYGLTISPLGDTEVVVYDGAAKVRLQDGESETLGEGAAHRSLLVMAGRPLRLLPHPREDAAAAKTAAASPAPAREWPDCLHGKNGALRPDIELVAACQRAQRARLGKAGDLSLADSADLREHQREELRQFARAHGWLPSAAEADAEPAPADAGDGPVDASAVLVDGHGAPADGRYMTGIDDSLAKSLQSMGFDPASVGGAGRLSSQDQALLQQLRASSAGAGAAAGGGGQVQVSPEQLNMLFKALLSGASGAKPAPSGDGGR